MTVTIQPLASDSFELVARWLSRPEINRWLSGDWRYREANPSILAIAMRNRRNQLYLVRSDGEPCGLVALGDVDQVDKMAMVWYLLGEDKFAGCGITSAALCKLSRLAFEQMGMSVLFAWTMEDNLASQRVLEKSGFQLCGRIRKAAESSGRQVDRIYFDLTATDIAAKRGDESGFPVS